MDFPYNKTVHIKSSIYIHLIHIIWIIIYKWMRRTVSGLYPLISIHINIYINMIHMVVSYNGGTQKWMVYNRTSQSKMDDLIEGTPMTQETSKWVNHPFEKSSINGQFYYYLQHPYISFIPIYWIHILDPLLLDPYTIHSSSYLYPQYIVYNPHIFFFHGEHP